MYGLIIIGGGPAGVAAGIYAARKKIKTLLIAESFGGQSLTSADVQNWIGTKSVSGYDLSKMLEDHLKAQEDTEILEGVLATKIEKIEKGFRVTTSDGKNFEAITILLTLGSRRRKLDVLGEKELDGKGVVYCSICDAPIFKNKVVAVVGGGNSALEGVIDLIPYATDIYIMTRSEFKGDPITQEKVKVSPKVKILTMNKVNEVLGVADGKVTGLKYEDKDGKEQELKLDGVFVEIGSMPNSGIVQGLVEINPQGEVVVDHKTQRSSLLGIWAAGDVSDVLYKQNNISAGDAVKAVLNIYDYLHKSNQM
jgi:alkyl hydroperoxide reductase subunit F